MRKGWVITAYALIIIGVIGLAFNKFDLGNKQKISINKEWTFDAATLKNMTVIGSSDNLEVEFVRSNDGTGFIEVDGEFSQQVVDRIMSTAISGDSFQLDLSADSEFTVFAFDFSNPKTHITVTIPDGETLDTLDVNSTSGNTKVRNILAANATVTTTSGNLTVADTQIDNLILKANSGNIIAEEITSNLDVSITSGNMKITDLSGELSAKANSGNITVTQKTTGSAKVQATSGNVHFTVANGFSGIYNLRANSGNIKSPDSIGTSSDIINIQTTSGNIKVKE
ncbi:MAG: DUF4097 family beta strand repeat-containing protein [Candidatus Cohnella colombiensis]|uniref:DUF4097 family beta strand repeat-containing protein n=1 Tax=Candidatus Cohnella colombiensis TaxID=3121368 RepID=A0AA95EW80_9BACL|nr:MAG: DUF4097 family beta strand repeat-containing protein [Cohnella sp.]